jgi:GT2 family glycosyltransferase
VSVPETATAAPPLALVTVTHESERELAALLESVARHLPTAQVVVVDCASSDASPQVARDRRLVTTIELDENIGFGRASNVGLKAVLAPVTMLVNPDVELIDGSPLRLAAEVLRAPERLFAPLVLSPDGSRQDTVHPLPGSAPDLARSVVSTSFAGPALAPWKSSRPRRVGWAVGCALAARTETLQRLGPFDESIFLYSEDLELCLRAAEQRVETWFWPDARVVHHRAHSSNKAFGSEPFELVARARHDVVARRLGTRRARLDDVSQLVTFASRVLVKRALGRPAARERKQLEAVLRQRDR